jgi:hypothetical protein
MLTTVYSLLTVLTEMAQRAPTRRRCAPMHHPTSDIHEQGRDVYMRHSIFRRDPEARQSPKRASDIVEARITKQGQALHRGANRRSKAVPPPNHNSKRATALCPCTPSQISNGYYQVPYRAPSIAIPRKYQEVMVSSRTHQRKHTSQRPQHLPRTPSPVKQRAGFWHAYPSSRQAATSV